MRPPVRKGRRIDELSVLSVIPANGATEVANNATVRMQMSHDINPATVTASTITVMAGASPVAGSFSVNESGLITFTPTGTYTNNATITVTITTGVLSIDGKSLAASSIHAFLVIGAIMAAPSTVPADEATDVAVDANFVATFPNDIDEATCTSTTMACTYLVGETVTLKAGAYSVNGAIVTFNPTTDFALDTEYTVTMTTSIRGTANQRMAASHIHTFTTVAE